jgi:hypothetical protein
LNIILLISALSWPNRSQEISGGSFQAFLLSVGQFTLRRSLESLFQQFWAQLAKSLARFKQFWAQLAKALSRWLSWMLISNIFELG